MKFIKAMVARQFPTLIRAFERQIAWINVELNRQSAENQNDSKWADLKEDRQILMEWIGLFEDSLKAKKTLKYST